MKRVVVLLALALVALVAQTPKLPNNYHLKLVTPVDSKTSRAGMAIRAAVISPESLLNSYLEGTVERVAMKPEGVIRLRFDRLMYQGRAIPLQTELTNWVNSKGHEKVDDNEAAMRLEAGEFRSRTRRIWLDEGAELRVKSVTPR